MPKISVIIPTFNRADFLPTTLKSIQAQKNSDFEVLIIDDGSKDNTEEVVLPFLKDSRFKYYKKENGERGAARNYGAELSKGDYVNFFDSDDLMYPNHIETAISAIEKDGPKIFHLGYDTKDKDGNLLSESRTIDQNIIIGNPYSCNGIFIEKSFFLQHKFIEDRNLAASEDYELWFRLSAYDTTVHYPIITSTVIQHESRSVMVTNLEKLCKRRDLFFHYSFNDPIVEQRYHSNKKIMYSYWQSYIAIHLLIDRRKREALNYYLDSLLKNPKSFFTRRSIAFCKNLILK